MRQLSRQATRPPKSYRKVDDAFLNEVLRCDLVFGCHELAALHLQVTPGNVRDCFVLLAEWGKVRPRGVCSLKFPCAADFVSPPSSSSSVIATYERKRKVDCSALENVILDADELTDEFMQTVDERMNLKPSNSLQLCAKTWKVAADASAMGIFANHPRQVTISTAFVKKVAQFIATIPTCDQLVLPQFGMRATAPGYFADLVQEKKGHNRFGQIILGDCKLTPGSVTPSPDALAAVKSASRSLVLEHGNKPPMVELTATEEGVTYTTAVAASCSCGGEFEIWPNCTVAASTCGDGGVEELYFQSRCIACECVLFAKVDVAPASLLQPPSLMRRGGGGVRGGKRKRRHETAAPELTADPYAFDHRIKTLYLEGVPTKDGVLYNRLSCFTEVENIYVGDTSTASGPLASRAVARFLGRFKKIKNVVALLPKKSDKSKFADDVKVACPALQRLCLTKRHEEAVATSRFAFNVVPPPSKKDVLVTKVRWPVSGGADSDVNVDSAAAVARCTSECNMLPYATGGLYVFKKNA